MRLALWISLILSVNMLARSVQADSVSVKSCDHLMTQLWSMHKAQKTLLNSLLRKNETMSTTLDRYASKLANQGNRAAQNDLLSLRSSANAYRSHQEREQQLVSRFDKQSVTVISEIENCIKINAQAQSQQRSSDLVQR